MEIKYKTDETFDLKIDTLTVKMLQVLTHCAEESFSKCRVVDKKHALYLAAATQVNGLLKNQLPNKILTDE